MWKTKQIGYGLWATFLLAGSGVAFADPLPTDRGGLEARSDEAFEDLDRNIDPSSAKNAVRETAEEPASEFLTEGTEVVVESETVVSTTETNGRTTAPDVERPYEPSQKELYERLLREEAAGDGYTTEYDDDWVETPTRADPAPQRQTTTVVIEDDDDYRRRYRRSGLWYFFHHLVNGRPHHVHRDSYRTHRAAEKAKRRARAERRARRVVAERRAKRAKAERRTRKRRAERQAKRDRAERRARRNEAKHRASRRAAKRQRRASRVRTNDGRRSRRGR